jgi:hypothetical protein
VGGVVAAGEVAVRRPPRLAYEQDLKMAASPLAGRGSSSALDLRRSVGGPEVGLTGGIPWPTAAATTSTTLHAVLLLEGDFEVFPLLPYLPVSSENLKLRLGQRRHSGVVPLLKALP